MPRKLFSISNTKFDGVIRNDVRKLDELLSKLNLTDETKSEYEEGNRESKRHYENRMGQIGHMSSCSGSMPNDNEKQRESR